MSNYKGTLTNNTYQTEDVVEHTPVEVAVVQYHNLQVGPASRVCYCNC